MNLKSFHFIIKMTEYKKKHSLENRTAEVAKIREKYPGRVPVIVEMDKKSSIEPLDKKKFLVPNDITVGQFKYIIRKRLQLSPEKALFLHTNNTLPPVTELMSAVYKEHQEKCGFLFMVVSEESVFG